jgi:hypothetical protein
MAKEFKQVRTIEELRKILDKGASEFFVQLWGGARSWKTLTYADKLDKDGNYKIHIYNDFDATVQVLTEKNLFNRKYTNIGFAMERGGFFYAWT